MAALGFAGCSVLTSLDGLAPTDAGAGPDAGEAGADAAIADAGQTDAPMIDAPTADAPTGDAGACAAFAHGPKMALAGSICIDTTEVRNADYQLFIAAKGTDVTGQAPECAWNATWQPDAKCTFDPGAQPDYPVVAVDQCDAAGYCKWAGKRLCGKVGGGVVPGTSMSVLDDAKTSERTAACTAAGVHKFPYGDTFDAEACNGGEHSGTRAIVSVATTPGCVGGYPGIFDMAGNVHEWENACDSVTAGDGGANDNCAFRGGSYHDLVQDSCFTAYSWARSMIDCDIGFRCCGDP